MRTLLTSAVVLAVASLVGTATADPVLCQKTIAKQYTVLKKKTLKGIGKCLDKENKGDLPGPCPDMITADKLAVVRQKVEAKVALNCSMADATALGFSGCGYGQFDEDSAVEASCRALPVTTPAELASCITCWKEADFYEFLSVLYASHALELCGGALGMSSTVCSEGGCAGPSGATPDQRDLGDTGENDCQKAIGKAGIKYLLSREKLFEKCALAGGTSSSCHGDAELQLKITTAQTKASTIIHDKCGNRDPLPNVPFCCKTTGNSCVAAADRETCETGGGQVQEGKVCGGSNTCDPVGGGNQKITWWDVCTSKWCSNAGGAVTTLDELIDCVGVRADEIVDSMLCYQFPDAGDGWLCPGSPSGAFLE
jgi:hypothetical protein